MKFPKFLTDKVRGESNINLTGIRRVQLYSPKVASLSEAQRNQQRAGELLLRGVGFAALSPRQVVEMGTGGIKAQIESSLGRLRSLGKPDEYVPSNYTELNEACKPAFCSGMGEKFDVSEEGFQGPDEDVATIILRNAQVLSQLSLDPLAIIAALSTRQGVAPFSVGCYSQLSPFGDGAAAQTGLNSFPIRSDISPCYGLVNSGWWRPSYGEVVGYSALIPPLLLFWYYTEGRGSPYHLSLARCIWQLQIGDSETCLKAYLEDLRQLRENLTEARDRVGSYLDDHQADHRNAMHSLLFGMAGTLLKDSLLHRLMKESGNSPFYAWGKPEKTWPLANGSYTFFDVGELKERRIMPKQVRAILDYHAHALAVIKRNIAAEESLANFKQEVGLNPPPVREKEYAFIHIPRDDAPLQVYDCRLIPYHECVPWNKIFHYPFRVSSPAVWAVWSGPRREIYFDLDEYYDRGHGYTSGGLPARSKLPRVVSRAAKKLVASGFDPRIRAKFFYLPKADRRTSESTVRSLGELAA